MKICYGILLWNLLWHFAMEFCYGILLWNFAMEFCYENLWLLAMEICYGCLLWKFAPNCCTLLAVRCSFGRAVPTFETSLLLQFTVNSCDFILGSIPQGVCSGTVSPNMPVKAAKATFTLKARPVR